MIETFKATSQIDERDKDGAKNLQSNIVLQISILIPSNSQASIAVVSINNIDLLSLSPWLTNLQSPKNKNLSMHSQI